MSAAEATCVVAVGGLDPSCGAGIVADARSVEAMGALPLAVATAVTVQSGTGVRSFSALPVRLVLGQLEELLQNLPVRAIKIGQIPTASLASSLARRLLALAIPVVLDPVLVASGGGALVEGSAASAIADRLLPLATLVTVNLDEASLLAGFRVTNVASMKRAAAELSARGAEAVLVKGGHLCGDPVDVLHVRGEQREFRSTRLAGSMHGTGCALASAAAARLALGDDVTAAVEAARKHVRELIGGAVSAGEARLRSAAKQESDRERKSN